MLRQWAVVLLTRTLILPGGKADALPNVASLEKARRILNRVVWEMKSNEVRHDTVYLLEYYMSVFPEDQDALPVRDRVCRTMQWSAQHIPAADADISGYYLHGAALCGILMRNGKQAEALALESLRANAAVLAQLKGPWDRWPYERASDGYRLTLAKALFMQGRRAEADKIVAGLIEKFILDERLESQKDREDILLYFVYTGQPEKFRNLLDRLLEPEYRERCFYFGSTYDYDQLLNNPVFRDSISAHQRAQLVSARAQNTCNPQITQ